MPQSLYTAAHGEIVAAVIALRKAAGMTQRQLAAAVGREHNYIARIETGQRRVDLVEFLVLCQACGADPAQQAATLAARMATQLPARRLRQ